MRAGDEFRAKGWEWGVLLCGLLSLPALGGVHHQVPGERGGADVVQGVRGVQGGSQAGAQADSECSSAPSASVPAASNSVSQGVPGAGRKVSGNALSGAVAANGTEVTFTRTGTTYYWGPCHFMTDAQLQEVWPKTWSYNKSRFCDVPAAVHPVWRDNASGWVFELAVDDGQVPVGYRDGVIVTERRSE